VYGRLVVLAVAVFGLSSISAIGDDWNPQRAAQYLDGRLQQWFAWKPAASPEGPCVSCHTGMTYLLARPALGRRLGEAQPTPFETGLLDRLRANVGAKPESYLQGVEVIFAALFLSERDAGKPMSADTRKAFDQLWSLQLQEGPSKGRWDWLTVDLDPWEHSESAFFGAALAAIAAGNAGAAYVNDPAVASHVATLMQYLRTAAFARRPLHDRLALLWSSSKRRELLSTTERESLVTDLFDKQQPDGGWTIASLGPWTPHPGAPAVAGSSSYATAFVTYVLQRAGVSPTERHLARALLWLTGHQDRETGAWPALSMNKAYSAGSMESFFMQDAATAFASLALIEAGR
jgi:squalene-hopene/tetraprenyl-beta-curcumene cyclase